MRNIHSSRKREKLLKGRKKDDKWYVKIGNTRKQVKDEVKRDREREGKDTISVKT